MKGRRRVLLVLAAAVVVLGAAVLVADRAAQALLGVGLFWQGPTMTEVLDGRGANQERLSALAAVKDSASGFGPSGTTVVGFVDYTSCEEGAHDWKRRDDYRLICTAHTWVYRAWSGDYLPTRRQVHPPTEASCSGPDYDGRVDAIPVPHSPITDRYTCAPGMTVRISFASAEGLQSTDWIVQQGIDRSSSRYVDGATPDELVSNLAGYQWFVTYEVGKEFYRD